MTLKSLLLTIAIALVSATILPAQILKGVIKTPDGEAISGATMFIQSLGLGIVAANDGSFSTNVKSGKYLCEFRCMGYETKTKEIEVGEGDTFVEVILPVAPYMIQEVRFGNREEDPAYYIIRRAIAMAPYYRSYIKAYSYEAHQKGTFKADKLPSFVTRREVSGITLKDIVGQTFIVESMVDVSFSAPNDYTLHVKAYNSSIPAGSGINTSSFSVRSENIYNDRIYNSTSPIASDALQYYNYVYIEGRLEGDYWVSKIRVVPKKKTAELLEGYLYINEDTWNVSHFDLSQSAMGVTARYRQYFNQIEPDVFVPTSESVDYSANILGVKVNGESSIARKYENIEIDTLLPVPVMISLPKKKIEETVVVKEIPKTKTEQKIDQMIEKGSLNNREAHKLAQLLQKRAEESSSETGKKSLEIKRDGDLNIVRSSDTLAAVRDSTYWHNSRILPLTETEKRGYILGDSLRAEIKQDSSEVPNELSISIGILGGDPITGDIKLFKNEKWSLYAGGLLSAVREYNFVDGVWLGESLTLNKKLSDKADMYIKPSVHYTTARKEITWEVTAGINYAPKRLGRLTITAGDRAEDFNRSGAFRAENTISSLFYGKPYIHFYRNKHIGAQNRIDISNGLTLVLSADYADRSAMDYNTTYSIFRNNSIRTNTPDSPLFTALGMAASRSLQSSLEIFYTPKYYYRILDNGRKWYSHSAYPTFGLSYRKGWRVDNSHNYPEFDQLELTVSQRINLGLFDNIRYSLNAGKFFNKRNMSFADIRHFRTNPAILTAKDMGGFQLLDNYTYSTDNYWGQAEFDYTSAYLLIKNIRALQSIPFDEALHLRYLYTPVKKHYWEAGYSIGFSNIMRIGVFTSWDKFTYRGVGVSFNISLYQNMLR